jgi:hypothetical protein
MTGILAQFSNYFFIVLTVVSSFTVISIFLYLYLMISSKDISLADNKSINISKIITNFIDFRGAATKIYCFAIIGLIWQLEYQLLWRLMCLLPSGTCSRLWQRRLRDGIRLKLWG